MSEIQGNNSEILMMEQRSVEWFNVRCGVITGSAIMRLITRTGKSCAQADGYINELLAEKLTGHVEESFVSFAMQRGIDMEPEALASYMAHTNQQVKAVGFVKHNEYEIGCSPDGIGEDRGVEIKVPMPHNHVSYLRANKCPDKYYGQVQMCMWLTGKKLWDFYSYSDVMRPLSITVPYDPEWISKMVEIVIPIHDEIQKLYQQFKL
jgi:hypothetical protein